MMGECFAFTIRTALLRPSCQSCNAQYRHDSKENDTRKKKAEANSLTELRTKSLYMQIWAKFPYQESMAHHSVSLGHGWR